MACRLSRLCKSSAILFAWIWVALAALAATTSFAAAIIALFRGSPFTSPDNLYAGLVCSLIAWLFVGVFHLRKETVQLRVSNPDRFLRRMQAILEDLGFQWVHMSPRLWRTRPGFRALALGEGITMRLEGNKAMLTGPRLTLDRIRRRYRMVSQLDGVQESLQDSKLRLPECYLKRFELSLRLEPDQLAEFQSAVVDVLAKEGDVVLDLQLLVSSDDGMRESVWIQRVRPWLDELGVYYECHKDHPQRVTRVGASAETSEAFLDTCVWSEVD